MLVHFTAFQSVRFITSVVALSNITFISVTFSTFHALRSISFTEHPLNIADMLVTLLVSNPDTFNEVNDEHPLNI